MSRSTVIVAAFADEQGLAETICQRLTEAWREPKVPQWRICDAMEIDQEQLEPCGGLLIVAPPAPVPAQDARILTLLSCAEEATLPRLALVQQDLPRGNNYEFGGAVIHRVDESDAVVVAALGAMLHRQLTVDRLRQEVTLARRFHGGLEGQVAKLHEELRLAATVQREFLPHELPSLRGVEFGAMWRPTNFVSGDIYNVTRLDEEHVCLFIADAIGHGVPAALMTMVICRSLLPKEITADGYRLVPPSEVLERLNNDMIRRQGETTRFATAVYGLINCRTRQLTIAGAGHPPTLLYRADGTTEEIKSEGGLLGIFPGETYPQTEVQMGLDDQLLMYSDGFELAFPEEGEHKSSTERYLDEFQALRDHESPKMLIRELARRIDDQCGSLNQRDDVTLLCMRTGHPISGNGTECMGDEAIDHVAPVCI